MVECRGVGLTFASVTGPVDALHGIDARFDAGTVNALMGPTGSGKSSLLRLLAGQDRPTAGWITVAGSTLSSLGTAARRRLRRRSIGFVFQRPAANLLPYLDVAGHLRLASQLRGPYDRAETDDLLDRLGLAHRRSSRPNQLSGGEQQRLALAMAVTGRPAVLLADEPTAELDHASAGRVLDALRSLSADGTCVILSSHDPAVVAPSDQIVRLDHGRHVGTGSAW